MADTQEKSLNILIAEDNEVNQKILKVVLEKIGQQPDIVSNGAEAVEACRNKAYDLIFMDCQMPEMDGLEATTIIREDDGIKNPDCYICAVTAFALDGDREKCIQAGMDDYLSKPYNIQTIREIVHNCLSTAP